MAQFATGRFCVTQGVGHKMMHDLPFRHFCEESYQRYLRCDWGELCAEDKALNDSAVANNDDRILASYVHPENPDWKLWIITEWDRSATTLLFPSEY